MIVRTVSSRVVDELSVRLAGATEQAIDEIVRRRSEAIKLAVEVERLRHPGHRAARSRAHARVPARQAVRDRRCRRHRSRAPSRAWARRPRSAQGWPTRLHSSMRRWRSSWPWPPSSTTTSARTTPAPRMCASYSRSMPARRSRQARRRRARRRRAARPQGSRAHRGAQPRVGRTGRQAHRAQAGAHAARARDPVRRRRRDRRGARTSRSCATPAGRHCATTSSRRPAQRVPSVRRARVAAHPPRLRSPHDR